VLRLDSQLNLIYAKGFGTEYNDYCMSIQLVRNYDYVYIGGHNEQANGYFAMFFVKFDGFVDTVISS
jgi:hypothetical protein